MQYFIDTASIKILRLVQCIGLIVALRMKMLEAEIIAKTLKSIGVKIVFLFPGGTITPLLDALIKEGIEYIYTRNEQGAGYGAIGAAKVTGFPQV